MKASTVLKTLSLVFTLLLILLAAPIVFLLLTDANNFKPQLEQLAQQQGVELDISGDLNWDVYPDIVLEVNQVALKTESNNVDLEALIGIAKLQVELRPLFSGQLKVRGIEVLNAGFTAHELAVNESEQIPEADQPDSAESKANIQVELILLNDVELSYQPHDAEKVKLNIDHLEISDLNLAGETFVTEFALELDSGDQNIQVVGDAELTIDTEAQNYRLTTEWVDVERLIGNLSEPRISASLAMTASANLSSNQWNLTLSQAQIDDLLIKANLSGAIEPVSALGQIEVNDGQELLNDFLEQKILNSFAARASLDYSPERVLINDAWVEFNDSQLRSNIQYYFPGDKESASQEGETKKGETKRSQLRFDLDQINLDNYISESSQETEPSENNDQNPLEFLESLSATDASFRIGELHVSGQKITEIVLSTVVDNSEANIEFDAKVAEGTVNGRFEARATQQPQLIIANVQANQINLEPLTKGEAGSPMMSGMADLNFAGQLQSLSGGSILEGFDGSGEMNIKDLMLKTMNVEQSICVSAQQLGATAALAEQWQAGTSFDQMNSPFEIQSGQLLLEQIGTGFGNVKLSGRGTLDLTNQDFAAKFSLLIQGDRTSEQGCSVNKYLRNTSLPLSCQGNLSEDGESSCGLDSSVVKELLKGQIKNQIGRQLNRLLGGDQSGDEQEATDASNTSESEQKDSSDEVKDVVRGLLEGLLK